MLRCTELQLVELGSNYYHCTSPARECPRYCRFLFVFFFCSLDERWCWCSFFLAVNQPTSQMVLSDAGTNQNQFQSDLLSRLSASGHEDTGVFRSIWGYIEFWAPCVSIFSIMYLIFSWRRMVLSNSRRFGIFRDF